MVKLLAFHLPQYHSFPENDEWWGEGFTDWENVRKAVPLYNGHDQPKVPLNGYYNMLDHETHKQQAELAKKYGLYGFCYYHYWFGGKMLMEKPLEIILRERDVNLPYCMCWANEPWTRSWNGKNKEIIMPQVYGEKTDWVNHFDYLLQFFKDDRYIKVENKPLFVIYRTKDVDCCDDMIACWDEESKKHGFDGIYICEEKNAFQTTPTCKNSCAVLNFEPGFTRNISSNIVKKGKKYLARALGRDCFIESYPAEVEEIIRRPLQNQNKKEFLGAFTGWDNTPRRKTNGTVSEDCTPETFQYLLANQIRKSNDAGAEFLFINAWNEWAEGAYLEPDEKNGYAYLEAVRNAIESQ